MPIAKPRIPDSSSKKYLSSLQAKKSLILVDSLTWADAMQFHL